MKRVTVTLGNEDAFFARGKTIAALADAGKPIPSEWIISFGDPADLLKVLTPARLELIRALKSGPSSLDNKSLHEIAKTTGCRATRYANGCVRPRGRSSHKALIQERTEK